MLKYGDLLSFPLKFKNLESKIKDITLKNIDAIKYNDHIFISATANTHNLSIYIYDKTLAVSSPVMVTCSCDFFKYNLAYGLDKIKSLIDPESFFLRAPRKKNPSLTPSACKHIILAARTLYQNRNLIKQVSE